MTTRPKDNDIIWLYSVKGWGKTHAMRLVEEMIKERNPNETTNLENKSQVQTIPHINFKVDDHKCKYCAVVEFTRPFMDLTPEPRVGVIFVKKCGYWSFRDYNGNKLDGGDIGTYDELIKAGTIIINEIKGILDERDKHPKSEDDNDFLEIVDTL